MHSIKELKNIVTQAMKNFGTSSDSIACQLYERGVRKSICGDEEKCALAQYVANSVGKGYTVAVDGDAISVFEGNNRSLEENPLFTVKMTKRFRNFISRFDDGEYSFLT